MRGHFAAAETAPDMLRVELARLLDEPQQRFMLQCVAAHLEQPRAIIIRSDRNPKRGCSQLERTRFDEHCVKRVCASAWLG